MSEFFSNYVTSDDLDSEITAFTIDSDKKADWAIGKIKEEQENTIRLRQIAISKIVELQNKIKELDERTERRTGNLKALLMDYMQTVKPTKQTKTQTQYELLSGKLVWKKQQPLYERDEAALQQSAHRARLSHALSRAVKQWLDTTPSG